MSSETIIKKEKKRSASESFMHTLRRVSSHLDWNEDVQEKTNKPEGRTWTNVVEVILNAWCAGYYQGYCHQKYGIFPGTMTGNTWSALRELQNGGVDSTRKMWFKFAAIVMWFSGNFCGLEIMRKHTATRASFLKWFDLACVTIIAVVELAYGDANDWNNPVKSLMMLISFGSGMSTVYFRMIYGVVTNRLTGNIYRLARGAQDVVHGTDGCPNWKLTVGICIMFCFGLYTFYAPWASDFGLFLPVIITFGWEVIETIYETLTDGNPDTDDEGDVQEDFDEDAEKEQELQDGIIELEERLAKFRGELNTIQGKDINKEGSANNDLVGNILVDEFSEPSDKKGVTTRDGKKLGGTGI